MADAPVIDLRDKSTPPPDDPDRAPYGWRWDAKGKEWKAKRSNGGRKAGASWLGKSGVSPGRESDTPGNAPDMDGFEAQFGEDPGPAYATGDGPKVPKSRPKVSAKTKGDITGAVGMIGLAIGGPLMSMDPYCGTALMENMDKIAAAVVPLLCQSATVVSWFTDQASDWMLWFKLLLALSPVAVAVGRHHILKTVELVADDEGNVMAVDRDLSAFPA